LFANKGSLTLDNTGSNVNQRTTSNTVAAARALSMSNGTLNFLVNGSASSAETFGALTSLWGGNKIEVTTTGQGSTLTFASLTSAISGGSTLVFESAGTAANFGTAADTVTFTTAPTLTNGILPRGVVMDGTTGGVNFATYGTSLTAYTAYNNNGAYTNINTAAAIDNVKVGAGFVTTSTSTTARTINSLNITGNGLTVDAVAGSVPLTIGSGGILVNGGSNALGRWWTQCCVRRYGSQPAGRFVDQHSRYPLR